MNAFGYMVLSPDDFHLPQAYTWPPTCTTQKVAVVLQAACTIANIPHQQTDTKQKVAVVLQAACTVANMPRQQTNTTQKVAVMLQAACTVPDTPYQKIMLT